jgi:hypothetical protein
MISNLERYKMDLDSLIARGEDLHTALQRQCFPAQTEAKAAELIGGNPNDYLDKLPTFEVGYQPWYSEAKVLVKLLLPDRFLDFVRLYEKPKPRKEVTYENYSIEDCLQGLHVTYRDQKLAGPDAAIPRLRQQLAIVKAIKGRFESSLFDIRQLVQADLFDSELAAAEELAKHKFTRAAGALAGVVLERHLAQVCDNHSVTVTKSTPTISELNDALKAASVVDVPQWRFVQHLADIRNLCDHSKKVEPTPAQVEDLINGTAKIVKTLF